MTQTIQEFYKEMLVHERANLRTAQGHLDAAWAMLLEILASGSRNQDLIRQAQDSVESCAAWVGRTKDSIIRYEAELSEL